jgi:hypothetical protein
MINLYKKLIGEVPMVYNGGGGKSGGTQTAMPAPINTTTPIGGQLDAPTETLDTDTTGVDDIDKKKMGTRGLQIPLASEKSTPTAATTGVQV